ncbi:HNH endonuclease [Catenulispora acidiphila DSM 44928]|uniref:HNH endonuclease n=1 Tax=Catenulispora acidiphila (strain DSM 44928 / JCM 14897 / NBRC 102108 / NRRL B-24433 / ID139908) TaxID=479433 RepID=C7QFC8_CATAD|nr:HNH endonuclease signature motif containing protein [Catenulispora acidiphila]ACU76705.1 HNH endonuclease [Catenulispora acidiphila DSM 44928]
MQTPGTTREELSWRATDAARKALIVDLGRSRGDAGRLIATVKALRKDPPTEDALRTGAISAPQARIIAEALAALAHQPDEVVDEVRRALIAKAMAGGAEKLREHAEDAAHRVAAATVLGRARAAEEKRGFHMTPVLDGYVPGGFLSTTGGDALLTALDSLADLRGEDEAGQADGDDLGKARADALVRLAEDRLRAGDLPQRHNGPTTMTIVMRADTAQALPGAPAARTGRGRAVPAAEAHMLRCEAALRAVLVDGDGEILWQGRKRRLATRAQYEAMAVRDGGCTAPGCDRPPRECDAHHDIPWGAGGHTDVDQMRLLCRRHHRELHDELWQRQHGWQDAEVRAHNEQRRFQQPRRPWYADTPAWYVGPSPWRPEVPETTDAAELVGGEAR